MREKEKDKFGTNVLPKPENIRLNEAHRRAMQRKLDRFRKERGLRPGERYNPNG